MRKIITYEADDGEVFIKEEDCKKYESWLNDTKTMEYEISQTVLNNKDILALNETFEKVSENIEIALGDVMYLFLKNQDSVLIYNKCANYFGSTEVCDGCFGMWLKYNEDWGLYESIEGELCGLKNLMKNLQRVKDGLDEND